MAKIDVALLVVDLLESLLQMLISHRTLCLQMRRFSINSFNIVSGSLLAQWWHVWSVTFFSSLHCSLEALGPLIDRLQNPYEWEGPLEALHNHHELERCLDHVHALHY